MGATSAARARRHFERFFEQYIDGRKGIDIGASIDPLAPDCDVWSYRMNGDAQTLEGVPDTSYDWIYSSHVLEHLQDPVAALWRWWRALRPGGHLISVVPDEDRYEQGVWPSQWNPEHLHTFTVYKPWSWSPVSINLVDVLVPLGGHIHCIKRVHFGYDDGTLGVDQTRGGRAEAGIEFVVEKLA